MGAARTDDEARAIASAGLGRAFDRGRDGPGGWWIFHEPELHFGEDILVPDVTGWRRERMPKLPDTDYVILAPDWACEVLSPATRKLDLVDKRPVYAREGVPHLWGSIKIRGVKVADIDGRTSKSRPRVPFRLSDGGRPPRLTPRILMLPHHAVR